MKPYIFVIFSLLLFSALNVFAQKKYDNVVNVGVGIGGYAGYYSYVEQSLPVFHVNYEIAAAKDFTLAPFIGFFSYKKSYYFGNAVKGYKYYAYHETVVPIGIKGFYYFDRFIKENSKWDLYVAGSIGFAIRNKYWDSDYFGDQDYYNKGGNVFLDLHLGAQYNFNNKLGAFADLSNGVSTLGLAFKLVKK
jgi:hypothetical protein